MAEIFIKDIPLKREVQGNEKIPVSSGGINAETITPEQLKEFSNTDVYNYFKKNLGISFVSGKDLRPATYTEEVGAIKIGGSIDINAGERYHHTSPILIKRGESLLIFANQQNPPFWFTDAEGSFYKDTEIKKSNGKGNYNTHWNLFTATEDVYISANYYRASTGDETYVNSPFKAYIVNNGFFLSWKESLNDIISSNDSTFEELFTLFNGKEYTGSTNTTNREIIVAHFDANEKFGIKVHLDGVVPPDAFITIYTDINNAPTYRIWRYTPDVVDKVIEIVKDFNIDHFRVFMSGAQGVTVNLTVYKYPKSIGAGQIPDNSIDESKLSDSVNEQLKNKSVTFKAFKDKKTLNTEEVLTLPKIHVVKNSTITANIKGSIDNILCGVGYNSNPDFNNRGYDSKWIELTKTDVKVYAAYNTPPQLTETFTHGLTLTDNTFVTIDTVVSPTSFQKTVLRIFNDKGDAFEHEIKAWGVGQPFVINKNTNAVDVEFSFMPKDISSPIWLIGDSYFSFEHNLRWTYYLIEYGFTKFFSNNQAGLSPYSGYEDLENLLTLGFVPRYLVWCLGMNGGTSENKVDGEYVINDGQKLYIDKVHTLCKKYGITPVFAIIPTVPERQKTGYDKYIKSLGVRYIDFADAVGTNELGQWNEGLLSPDKVHPTSRGAQVLAAKAISAFPEITENVDLYGKDKLDKGVYDKEKNTFATKVELGGKADKIITETSAGGASVIKTLLPNVFYDLGECGAMNIMLAAGEDGEYNEYMFSFKAKSAVLTLPASVKWLNDEAPTLLDGVTYEVSIVNNLAVIGG